MYDEAASFLSSLRAGDILDFGKHQFVVWRAEGVTVLVTKARTSGKKLYMVTPTILTEDECVMGVIEVNAGTGDMLDKPLVVEADLQDVVVLDELPPKAPTRKRSTRQSPWKKATFELALPRGKFLEAQGELRGSWGVHQSMGVKGSYTVTLFPSGLAIKRFSTRDGWVAPKNEAKRRVDLMLEEYPDLEHASEDEVRAAKAVITVFMFSAV